MSKKSTMKTMAVIIAVIAAFVTVVSFVGNNVFGCTFLCDANIRDAYGNIIGTGSEGDYVEVQGYDENGRVIVYDYTNGTCGTVVSGSLDGEYYYEPESYYDDYDCYYEENDVNYDCDCDETYSEDVGCYETYYDCPENYSYTPELETCEYNETYVENYDGETYVETECDDNYVDNDEYVDSDDCSDNNDYVDEYVDEYVDNTEDNTECYSEDYVDDYYTEYGNTWIDINLSCQTISVYSESNKVLASCCVTGMAGLMDTPTGVWSILDKQRNATLVGDDYQCPVDFWMPFTGSGCGIHDANWREDFSSDAYLYNGSHGCVNVGYDTAANIYDLVDCGTSVVVHY